MTRSRRIHTWKSFLLATLMLLAVASANAQTTQFTYQGKLTDSGSLASGSYDFQLKLFNTATVGTGLQVGSTLTLSSITVTAGSFTVQLDFGSCAGCFPGLDRFLEIAVKPSSGSTYTTLSPRQQINSAPYALKSANATAADGLSIACVNCITSSQIASVSGSAIVGTIPPASLPPGSTSYIQNTTTQQASSNFNISGNGTLGGSLGIGANSPADVKLEVAGSMRIYPLSGPGSLQFRNRTSADYSQVVFVDNTNTYTGYLGYIGANAPLGNRNDTVEFGTNGKAITFLPNNTEVMRLSTNGNVGIGTNSPTLGKLHVFGGGGNGVYGESATGVAVYGVSTSFEGVRGESYHLDHGAVVGVHNNSGIAVFGQSSGTGVAGKSLGGGRGVYGESSGTGVYGKSLGGGVGVYGESNQFEGVRGVANDVNHGAVVGVHNGGGAGVFGTSSNGNGVVGESQWANRSGVFGYATVANGCGGCFENTAGGKALGVVGNAVQSRSAGGMVKAMGYIDPFAPGANKIVRCYNSQATGSTVSTSRCGFVFTYNELGGYTIDFGFEVDDRFIFVTAFEADTARHPIANVFNPSGNSVRVFTAYSDERSGGTDIGFYIIVL